MLDRPRLPIIVIESNGDPWLFNRDRDPLFTFEEPDIENKEYIFADVDGRAVDARYVSEGSELQLTFVGGELTKEAGELERQLMVFAERIGWAGDAARLIAAHVPYPILVRYLVWARKHRKGPESTVR